MPVLRAKIDGVWVDIGGLGPPGPQGLQGLQGLPGAGVAPGGVLGQVLVKQSSTNFDTAWQTPATPAAGLPVGGTVGQVLTKLSSVNFAAAWQTPTFPILPNNVALKSFQSDGSSISDLIKLNTNNEINITAPRVPAVPLVTMDGRVHLKPFLTGGESVSQLYVLNDGSAGGGLRNAEVLIAASERADLFINTNNRARFIIQRIPPLAAGKVAAEWCFQVHSDGALVVGANENEADFALGIAQDKTIGLQGHVLLQPDKVLGSRSGRVMMYDRSADGRIVISPSSDAYFNEAGGTSRFVRGIQLTDNNWIYTPGGIYMMMYEPSSLRIHYAWNQNAQFNAAGGFSYFAQGIEVAGSIFKAGVPYNFPDYVFEHAFTGKVTRYAEADGAKGYEGLMSLVALEAYVKRHWRLPYHTREELRVDVARRAHDTLAEVERLYLHLFAHERRLASLEAKNDAR